MSNNEGKTWGDISDSEKCNLLSRPSRKSLMFTSDMPLHEAVKMIEENAINEGAQ